MYKACTGRHVTIIRLERIIIKIVHITPALTPRYAVYVLCCITISRQNTYARRGKLPKTGGRRNAIWAVTLSAAMGTKGRLCPRGSPFTRNKTRGQLSWTSRRHLCYNIIIICSFFSYTVRFNEDVGGGGGDGLFVRDKFADVFSPPDTNAQR